MMMARSERRAVWDWVKRRTRRTENREYGIWCVKNGKDLLSGSDPLTARCLPTAGVVVSLIWIKINNTITAQPARTLG